MGLNCLDDDLVSTAQINLIMLSYHRPAPPMKPSRSLEGLEKVIPPGASYPPNRPDLHLNKPLPASPLLVDTPDISAWSDDSSLASFCERTESEDSSESYPIFVSDGSDDYGDLDEFVDHPSAAASPLPPVKPTSSQTHDSDIDPPNASSSSLALKAFLSEERYGSNFSWAQTRMASNHYFREKKWNFFPELGPSTLQNSTSLSLNSGPRNSRRRRKDGGRLNLPAWNHASAGPGFAIASGVRDSIRSYVHRTLSKGEKPNQPRRPVTAPSAYPYKTSMSLSEHSLVNSGSPMSSLDISNRSRTQLLSATDSSTNERHSDDQPTRRSKQLAVPISQYQKYGANIWDKSGGTKRVAHGYHRQGTNVRFPKYNTTQRPKYAAHTYSSSVPTLPSLMQSPSQQQHTKDHVKTLHGGTSHVRGALDDAKRKVTRSKSDRRRERLKAQIKLVGPVNPYST